VLCFEERVRQQDVLKDPVKQADLQHNGMLMMPVKMMMMMMMMMTRAEQQQQISREKNIGKARYKNQINKENRQTTKNSNDDNIA